MKIPLLLLILSFSAYVISGSCTGLECATEDGGNGCRSWGGRECTASFQGQCYRLENSSGITVWIPGGTASDWYGFISNAPNIQIYPYWGCP